MSPAFANWRSRIGRIGQCSKSVSSPRDCAPDSVTPSRCPASSSRPAPSSGCSARRRLRAAAIFAAAAALAIAPWMIRSTVLTGNPLAPLANRVFPNPYFHIATETELAEGLRSLGEVRPAQVPWELAFGDRLGGTYGPLFFALPLGLLALRRREGRLLWLAAAILALPWLTNTGARFLMQSIVLAGFALAWRCRDPRPGPPSRSRRCSAGRRCSTVSSPRTASASTNSPSPPRSASNRESSTARTLEEYNVARMIERATPPDSRTLALLSVANAYLDREVARLLAIRRGRYAPRYAPARVAVLAHARVRLEGRLAGAGRPRAPLPRPRCVRGRVGHHRSPHPLRRRSSLQQPAVDLPRPSESMGGAARVRRQSRDALAHVGTGPRRACTSKWISVTRSD